MNYATVAAAATAWEIVERIATIIVPTGTFMTAVWLIIRAMRMYPVEKRKGILENRASEADLAATFQDIAKDAALQVVDYQKEIADLRRQISTLIDLPGQVSRLTAELDRYKIENARLTEEMNLMKCERLNDKEENAALREWAEALVGQIKAVPGLEPVNMRPIKIIRCGKDK